MSKQKELNFTHKKERKGFFLGIGGVIVLALVLLSFVVGPLLQTPFEQNSVLFGKFEGQPILYSQSPAGLLNNEVRNRTANLGDSTSLSTIKDTWRQAFDAVILRYAVRETLQNEGYFHQQQERDDYVIENYFTNDSRFDSEAFSRVKNDTLNELELLADLNLYNNDWLDLQNDIIPNSEKLRDLLTLPPLPLRQFNFAYYELKDYPKEEVEKYFLENQSLFESLDISRISVAFEDTQAMQEKIDAEGSDFAQLAETFSTDYYRNVKGSLERKTRHELQKIVGDQDFVDELFNAAQGDVLLWQTEETSVFYRINEAKITAALEDENTVADVRRYIEENELSLITDYLQSQAEQVRLAVNEEQDLIAIATEQEVQNFTSSDYVALSYGSDYPLYKPLSRTLDNSTIATAAENSDFFLQSIFSVPVGEVSEPLFLNGRIVVLVQPTAERDAELSDSPFGDNENILERYSVILLTGLITTVQQESLIDTARYSDNFDKAFNRLFQAS